MKRITPKTYFQHLRKSKVDQAFLVSFRSELANYITKRPIDVPTSFWNLHKTFATITLSVFAIIFVGSGATYASLGSLPGEPLYPVKLASEKIQLKLQKNPEKKSALKKVFVERRMREIEKIETTNPSPAAIEQSLKAISETLDEPREIELSPALKIASSTTTATSTSSSTPSEASSTKKIKFEKYPKRNINTEELDESEANGTSSTTEKSTKQVIKKSTNRDRLNTGRARLLEFLSRNNKAEQATSTLDKKPLIKKPIKPKRDQSDDKPIIKNQLRDKKNTEYKKPELDTNNTIK